MDQYTDKSLHFSDHSASIQTKLKQSIDIFDNMADLYIAGILSSHYNTNEYMYLFLSNLIENDLNYPIDDNIIVQVKPKGYMRVSLKNTDYTMNQKANIYYIIYGWPFFNGYNNNSSFSVGEMDGYQVVMPSDGLYLYRKANEDVYKYDSFIKTFLSQVPLASLKDEGEFGGAFVLLAMTYLTINGYKNYLDAKDGGFTPMDSTDQ